MGSYMAWTMFIKEEEVAPMPTPKGFTGFWPGKRPRRRDRTETGYETAITDTGTRRTATTGYTGAGTAYTGTRYTETGYTGTGYTGTLHNRILDIGARCELSVHNKQQ